jgi:hypothetical protein
LAGPVGVFVKFSTLQEYGVDRVFLLENNNVDSSQRNVVFLARGEKASHAQAIAGMYGDQTYPLLHMYFFFNLGKLLVHRGITFAFCAWDLKVDCVDRFPLYLVSLDPKTK